MTGPDPTAPARSRAQLPSEILLASVTLVAVAGFTRLFTDDGAIVGLLVAAVTAHLVNAAARRFGLGALATAGVVAAALVLQVSVVLYPHVSLAGLPTGTTVSTALDDLRQAWETFGEAQPPVPPERGFLLAATLAIWAAVSLADWAGLRIRATAEAVLPAGALFVFTVLLAEEGSSVPAATALALTVLGFALAQRTTRSVTDDTWVGGQAGPGIAALARRGGAMVVVAALAAGLVVPRLPTAAGDPVVEWRGQDDTGRTTISPLVNIRSRLVQQSNAVVFRVRAERPAYWRLTSLDRFDGELWSSNEDFAGADGDLPSEPPDATTRDLVQTYSIVSLGSIWAPAALTPLEVEESSVDLRWNTELATLIVPKAVPSIDGSRYQVTSRVPDFTPADLDARLPSPLPEELAEATRLPARLPAEVAALAREVTADTDGSPYAMARALQDWFRSEFTYDLEGIGTGHSRSAIRDFLRARRGYCEQFAGTYAAMARSLGLPARVAVGFTTGEVDASGDLYTVRGRNAHAWPEVFIPDAGWVPFEPTPNRGQPGTEQYTGVAPAQDVAEPPLPTSTTTTTTPPDSTSPSSTPPSDDEPPAPLPEDDLRADALPSDGATATDGGDPFRLALGVLAATVVLAAALAGSLAGLRILRRRRRHRVTRIPARIRAAWGDAVTAIGVLGHPRVAAETDVEYAARTAPVVGSAGPALIRLASLVTGTTWAPPDREADPALATEADGLARLVDDEVRRRLSWTQRLQRWIDPRPELRAQ